MRIASHRSHPPKTASGSARSSPLHPGSAATCFPSIRAQEAQHSVQSLQRAFSLAGDGTVCSATPIGAVLHFNCPLEARVIGGARANFSGTSHVHLTDAVDIDKVKKSSSECPRDDENRDENIASFNIVPLEIEDLHSNRLTRHMILSARKNSARSPANSA